MNDLEGMINSVLSNPDEMKKIMDMANSIMSENSGKPPEGPPPPMNNEIPPEMKELMKGLSSIPPEMSMAAMQLMKGLGKQKGGKHELLSAMRPYLSEGRRGKLDRAMQMSHVLGVGLNVFAKKGGLL